MEDFFAQNACTAARESCTSISAIRTQLTLSSSVNHPSRHKSVAPNEKNVFFGGSRVRTNRKLIIYEAKKSSRRSGGTFPDETKTDLFRLIECRDSPPPRSENIIIRAECCRSARRQIYLFPLFRNRDGLADAGASDADAAVVFAGECSARRQSTDDGRVCCERGHDSDLKGVRMPPKRRHERSHREMTSKSHSGRDEIKCSSCVSVFRCISVRVSGAARR